MFQAENLTDLPQYLAGVSVFAPREVRIVSAADAAKIANCPNIRVTTVAEPDTRVEPSPKPKKHPTS